MDIFRPWIGFGPDELRLCELVNRLQDNTIREVIVATNPTMEGDATATYISRLVSPLGIQVSALGAGLAARR